MRVDEEDAYLGKQKAGERVLMHDMKRMLAGMAPVLTAGVWVYEVCEGDLPEAWADVRGRMGG